MSVAVAAAEMLEPFVFEVARGEVVDTHGFGRACWGCRVYGEQWDGACCVEKPLVYGGRPLCGFTKRGAQYGVWAVHDGGNHVSGVVHAPCRCAVVVEFPMGARLFDFIVFGVVVRSDGRARGTYIPGCAVKVECEGG